MEFYKWLSNLNFSKTIRTYNWSRNTAWDSVWCSAIKSNASIWIAVTYQITLNRLDSSTILQLLKSTFKYRYFLTIIVKCGNVIVYSNSFKFETNNLFFENCIVLDYTLQSVTGLFLQHINNFDLVKNVFLFKY